MQSYSFEFPQFRKYVGIDTYYKIESEKQFVELIKVGQKIQEHIVNAVQYPEMLRIKDMLICLEERWQVITEVDYLDFKNQ